MKPVRRNAQMIFQDPYASLDPRMPVGKAIEEPLVIHGIGMPAERRERSPRLLERVHLLPEQRRATRTSSPAASASASASPGRWRCSPS